MRPWKSKSSGKDLVFTTMAYPEPLVIPPHSPPHKITFILLHGRGSSGEKFGPALLDTPIRFSTSGEQGATQSLQTLTSVFPHARFVFPTAARRRATLYGRAHTNQWFDSWKLDPPATAREELQAPGLCETTEYLHGLLRDEVAAVPGGAPNVVLGGLSQGCAASLISLLLWEGPPVAAVFGMCGWLPFAARLFEQLEDPDSGTAESSEWNDGWDPFDPFERDEDPGGTDRDLPAGAIRWLKEELRLPGTAPPTMRGEFNRVPVFLGHGVEDPKVNVVLGREACTSLSYLGIDVHWKEYPSLGHWYSGDMLRDVVLFLQANTKWV